MLVRTLTAVVGVPLLVGVVWVGGYPFAILVAVRAGFVALVLTRRGKGALGILAEARSAQSA